MDLIVCGDALWISCGTWVAFWNGSIGASFAAAVGALVALGVVLLSNRHQTHLAAVARGVAKAEAEKAREIAAVADMVSVATWVVWSYDMDESFNRGDAFQRIEGARVRLQLASSASAPIATALEQWATLLPALTMAESNARRREHHLRENIRRALGFAATSIIVCLPTWPEGDESHRNSSLSILEKATTDMAEVREAARKAGLLKLKPDATPEESNADVVS